MSFLKKNKRNRACVIGLDGVPCSMLAELAQSGVMPAMAGLIGAGHLHRMAASLPEISAVSWTNFMTGANSGTHGIFGFTDFKADSYETRFPNFMDVKTPALWDVLGEKGFKSIIINQPSTYPARKINGILVSGFVAVEMGRAVYPPAYRTALDKIGYQIDIDTMKAREDTAFFWEELGKTLAGRQRALNFFWNEPWDYFQFVITGTDRLHHFLWNAYRDGGHPHHQRFLDFYRQVDGIIGRIASSYEKMNGSREGLYLLSDHGFTGIVQEVSLNAWLAREGYLAFASGAPRGLEDIVPGKTTAFALDPNRIYLNLRKKFPGGSVDASEKKALREDLARKLEKLEYEGQKAVRKIFFAEDVYKGPLVSKGPDLIVVGHDGFDMKGSVRSKDVFGRTNLQGMHTWDDAFFWASEDVGNDLTIENLAPIILGNFK
jgi:predicted AlkP superfamily phosphohydrolase/phosphomutase